MAKPETRTVALLMAVEQKEILKTWLDMIVSLPGTRVLELMTRSGADGYLAKPVDTDTLIQQVEGLLNKPSGQGPRAGNLGGHISRRYTHL